MRERLKVSREGVEIEPETIYLQGVGASLWGDRVLFAERTNELLLEARLIP